MLKASSKRSGVGLWELPTNPVTPGVWPHDRPAVFVEVHAHQHVTGDAHPVDQLALAVLDLDHVSIGTWTSKT
jgi:hypothetical protein